MQVESKNHNFEDHHLVYHDKVLKCVCELCTCGKHRCPRPRVKGTFETSYSQQFKRPPVVQLSSLYQPYKYQQRHYSPDALKSSYKETYQPHAVQEQASGPNGSSRFQNVASKMILNRVPFTGSSSYKDQYKPFEIKPMQNNPQEGPSARESIPTYTYNKSPTVKFQGVSSYKASFSPPPKPQAKMNYSLPPQYMFKEKMYVPFYGETSYQREFPGYKIQPRRQQNLQTQRVKVNPVKFEGSSSYKDQFPAYKIEIPLPSQGSGCLVDNLLVPPVNYINEKKHIYYDPEQKKFI